MKRYLICPCGVEIEGSDEDDLVDNAKKHLAEAHPGLEYSRDEILFLAY
jgi:predicted small metal-binding protein